MEWKKADGQNDGRTELTVGYFTFPVPNAVGNDKTLADIQLMRMDVSYKLL